MKDIKQLYLAARRTKSDDAISEYNECVNQMFESNPLGYIHNLEYILKSSSGLKTFKPFIERYGLCVAAFDDIHSCFENCIDECLSKNIDATPYKEHVEYLDSFYNKYSNCFHMYEYFQPDLKENYMETYYGFNKDNIQNNKLVRGMINTFGEGAIPDVLILANNMNHIDQVIGMLKNSSICESKTFCQWITECSKDLAIAESNENLNYIIEHNLDTQLDNMRSRHELVIKESAIFGDSDLYYEYTSDDIHAIEDMISFKEYMALCTEGTESSNIMNEVYSLYEELDGLVVESVADAIIPMLPRAVNKVGDKQNFRLEDPNIEPEYDQDKKTNNYHKESVDSLTESEAHKHGDIPGYLNNYNLGDDDDLENYRRDSSINGDKPMDSKINEEPTENNDEDFLANDTSEDHEGNYMNSTSSNSNNKSSQMSNSNNYNYYYYTYQNSNNQNTNSYNKDSSTHDSHDKQSYDYSRGKGSHRNNTASDYTTRDNDEFSEATLNLFSDESTFTESIDEDGKPESDHPVRDAIMDIDQKARSKAQKVKQGAQNAANVGRAMMKPVVRTKSWITNQVSRWKDKDENKIKEEMCDPQARKGLFNAIKRAIKIGSLAQAGLLLNPLFIFLSVTRKVSKNKNMFRIRTEVISELKTELQVLDAKIQQADGDKNYKAKYKLMRMKGEIERKLLRVGGAPDYGKTSPIGASKYI